MKKICTLFCYIIISLIDFDDYFLCHCTTLFLSFVIKDTVALYLREIL